ncbi:MAG: hypothetical protein PQJ59_16765 [Spirochaetales bacterium]|nr:hypothetical protein [Spirochaetales bacterium]
MKTLKDFQKESREALEKETQEQLKTGPVKLSVDCTIETAKDISNPSVAFAIKRKWKSQANIAYQKAKKHDIRPLIPKKDQNINGFALDPEQPLPVWADGLTEQSEYTDEMLATGLFLFLREEYDEYYHNVLKALNLNPATISEEGRKILDGSYWK